MRSAACFFSAGSCPRQEGLGVEGLQLLDALLRMPMGSSSIVQADGEEDGGPWKLPLLRQCLRCDNEPWLRRDLIRMVSKLSEEVAKQLALQDLERTAMVLKELVHALLVTSHLTALPEVAAFLRVPAWAGGGCRGGQYLGSIALSWRRDIRFECAARALDFYSTRLEKHSRKGRGLAAAILSGDLALSYQKRTLCRWWQASLWKACWR